MRLILQLLQPLRLLFSMLSYFLGAGMARYLGLMNQSPILFIGLVWVLLVQSAAMLLAEYHRPEIQPYFSDETPRLRDQFRILLLQVSAAVSILAGGITVYFIAARYANPYVILYILLIFIAFVMYAIPPFSLFRRGYGEVLVAFLIAGFIPGLAFVLQAGEFHRILLTYTFPLALLGLASFLAFNFQSFITDRKYGRTTFLMQLTWQRAIPLHHVFVIIPYLLFGLARLLGFGWGIIWPIFLVFPLSLAQIYWLNRIGAGGKPAWKLWNTIANSTFGLAIYILAMTFWIR